MSEPIDRKEVLNAIKLLKNGKAPGHDAITKEILIYCWPIMGKIIEDLIISIFNGETYCEDFIQTVTFIPKKKEPKYIND